MTSDLDPYALDPAAVDLPELDAGDLPAVNPADPDADEHGQDDFRDLEGYGGSGGPPSQVWRRAVQRVADNIRGGRSNDVGMCLREIREVNEVAALFLSAKESLYGCAPEFRHRRGDWDKVPRGSIVYMDSPTSRYGHITESLGGGYVGSTDWPRARWGKVHGATITRAWGYTVAYWTPEVNNVRVWWPNSPKDEPAPEPAPRHEADREPIHEVIRRLAHIRARHIRAGREQDARAITAAIRELHRLTPGKD
jgi:hypothetical protein